MTPDIRRKLLYSIAFGALVFLILTIYADVGTLMQAFSRFQWAWLPVVLVCTSTNYLFRFVKWEYYTKVLGIAPSRRQNLIIFFSSFMMAVTPGKLGEVLKSYLLKQVTGTPVSVSAPVIIAERLTDFIGLIALMILGAWVFGTGRTVVAMFALVFALITALLAWRRGSLMVIDLLAKLPILSRHGARLHAMYDSMARLVRPLPLAYATVVSIVAWFFECLGYYVILRVFNAPPTLLKSAFIYAFSTIVGAVTMLPGGLGTTEGSLTGLAILAGVTRGQAVAATFLIRLATLWFAVLLGILVSALFQKRLDVKD